MSREDKRETHIFIAYMLQSIKIKIILPHKYCSFCILIMKE